MTIKISPELEQLYLDKIQAYVESGKTKTVVKRTTQRKIRYVNLGVEDRTIDYHPVEKETVYQEVQTITHEPTPDYVMQLIGDSLSEDKAIEFLTNRGYVVSDPTLVTQSSSNQGLTDSTVQLIRKKLLGIENAPNNNTEK